MVDVTELVDEVYDGDVGVDVVIAVKEYWRYIFFFFKMLILKKKKIGNLISRKLTSHRQTSLQWSFT